jgi:hypothetical protein
MLELPAGQRKSKIRTYFEQLQAKVAYKRNNHLVMSKKKKKEKKKASPVA